MATSQLTAPSISTRNLRSFEGLQPSALQFPSVGRVRIGTLIQRSYPYLVVKAATVVAPKYTAVKPLGDRVLVKIKDAEEKTEGGILLPTTAQTKPQGGELVAVGEGKSVGSSKVEISVKTGAQVAYSKYAGTEVEFNGTKHLILKDDDIIGILETGEVKDLKPLDDRVLIKPYFTIWVQSIDSLNTNCKLWKPRKKLLGVYCSQRQPRKSHLLEHDSSWSRNS